MKILFVENRYTTYLWDAIASFLLEKGHEVFWIVQNKQFTPKYGKKFYLEVQPGLKGCADNDPIIEKIIRADRGIRYFGVKTKSHIFQGRDQIRSIIEQIKPDVGFGEATLFHELLTLFSLKEKKIPYFFPISCRFPTGRIAFYWYDSLLPFAGDESEIPYDEALRMVKDIEQRKAIPHSLFHLFGDAPSLVDKLKDKWKITRGYLSGERYNTPSITSKLRLKSIRKKNKSRWDAMARKYSLDKNAFNILYPLQMQPESTIDVWANEVNDQTDIIRQLLRYLPLNCKLVIKPNPTSYMELNQELFELVENDSRIIVLEHSLLMDEVLPHIQLVVTTTGTIGIECIFANKPVITLVENYFNHASNCLYLDTWAKLPGIINMVAGGTFPILTEEEKVQYLNYLQRTSYPGFVGCTLTQKGVLDEANLEMLFSAFESILFKLVYGTVATTSPAKC